MRQIPTKTNTKNLTTKPQTRTNICPKVPGLQRLGDPKILNTTVHPIPRFVLLTGTSRQVTLVAKPVSLFVQTELEYPSTDSYNILLCPSVPYRAETAKPKLFH